MRLLSGTIVLIGVSFVSAGSSFAGAAKALIPHRAVYDLELQQASERSGIDSMFGRMVYEFNGSECAGYTVGFRFVTQLDAHGAVRLTDQQTTTYENLEEGTFRFLTKSYVNEKLDTEVRGTARADSEGTSVDLTTPRRARLTLDRAQFPTEQMISLIEKAKSGERFFQSRLYDGSEEGSKVMLTTSVVGSPKVVSDDGNGELAAAGDIADQPTWPVTIAYFDETKKDENTPIYKISFKLYENGVTRDLIMDYGEFALRGTLASLETFEGDGC